MKKCLVTGGSGFIGSALVKRLVKEGYYVRVLDSNIRGVKSRLNNIADCIDFIEADIRDYNQVKQACDGIDVVHHLAYINGTEYFYKIPEMILEIAVKGMMNIIDACKENKIKEIIVDKLGIEESEITDSASFTNDLGADSLDTVELIMEFEKEFNVSIPDEEAEKIQTVGDAVAYLKDNVK